MPNIDRNLVWGVTLIGIGPLAALLVCSKLTRNIPILSILAGTFAFKATTGVHTHACLETVTVTMDKLCLCVYNFLNLLDAEGWMPNGEAEISTNLIWPTLWSGTNLKDNGREKSQREPQLDFKLTILFQRGGVQFWIYLCLDQIATYILLVP